MFRRDQLRQEICTIGSWTSNPNGPLRTENTSTHFIAGRSLILAWWPTRVKDKNTKSGGVTHHPHTCRPRITRATSSTIRNRAQPVRRDAIPNSRRREGQQVGAHRCGPGIRSVCSFIRSFGPTSWASARVALARGCGRAARAGCRALALGSQAHTRRRPCRDRAAHSEHAAHPVGQLGRALAHAGKSDAEARRTADDQAIK